MKTLLFSDNLFSCFSRFSCSIQLLQLPNYSPCSQPPTPLPPLQAEVSAWDWVCLCEENWTDANKHYLTYEYVTPGKAKVKFPSSAHPGRAKGLQVVFVSSKLSAPVALASVNCVV